MSSRVITLTLNPALDIASTADAVRPMHKIRTSDEHVDPGGGGINVSRVVHALGGDTLALVLAGGVTGSLVTQLLDDAAVPHLAMRMAGRTRISLTVYDRTAKVEYRFVPEGPEVTEADWQPVLDELERLDGDWIVASGSLPRGMPEDMYARVARIARRRGKRFVLDTSKGPLKAALGSGIDLVKPSLSELEGLVGRPLPTLDEREQEARRLVREGAARMVVVTLGGEGAFLATANEVIHMPALEGPVRSAVGAGDAFLASMVLAMSRGALPRETLGWGIAAGAAAVAQVGTARVTQEAVASQYERLCRGLSQAERG
ncbi:MAG: 1-phosphofructokinase family hexose kinase [Acetobacteraceae bacterium]